MVDFLAFLPCDAAINFSLNDVSNGWGKVVPFSQISTSFVIFSYKRRNKGVSRGSYTELIMCDKIFLEFKFGQHFVISSREHTRNSPSSYWDFRLQAFGRTAYLLIIRGWLNYVVHQDWKKFLYSMDSSSVCSILGSTVYGLSSKFGLLGPLSSYRVYDVEYAKFVGRGSLFEMGEKLLDEDRLGL
jgi:hypothetical protein